MTRKLLAIILAALLLLTAVPVPAATTVPQHSADSRTGIAIEIGAGEQQNYLDQLEGLQSQFGVESKNNVFWLRGSDERWLVFTDSQPRAGEATVEGRVLSPEMIGSGDYGVIIADSITVNQTGEPVDLSRLQENPRAYANELVRVTAPYQQLTMAVESESTGTARLVTGGSFNDGQFNIQSASSLAKWSTFNASSADSLTSAFQSQLNTKPSVQGTGSPQWWISARTTVDVAVIIEHGEPIYYLVQTNVQSTSISAVSEIQTQGEDLVGEVVSFESSVIGGRISSQESILSVSRCAPMSATNSVTGCIPIPADTTLHSGVLFSGIPESKEDILPYVGLSSHHQQSVLIDERGTYRITGRVVKSSEMGGSTTSGYGLVVFNMARTGDLDLSSEVISRADSWHQERQESYLTEVQSASEPNREQSRNQSGNRSTTTLRNATTETESPPVSNNVQSNPNNSRFLGFPLQLFVRVLMFVSASFAIGSWVTAFLIKVLKVIKSLRGHEVNTSTQVPETLFGVGIGLSVLTWLTGGPDLFLFAGVVFGLLSVLFWLGKWVYREI